MEDIRKACGISRGGLYHHFGKKTAILDAIVAQEVMALADLLQKAGTSPIETLLERGSSQLGNEEGILASLKTLAEKRIYLSSLDQAIALHLRPVLQEKLAGTLNDGIDPNHIAELFLAINQHINHRVIMMEWSTQQSAAFAATALKALSPFLRDQTRLQRIIESLSPRS